MAEQQPGIMDRCEILTADKGYDNTKLIVKLWGEHRVKPVIDIRDIWKDGEETRLLTGKENIVYRLLRHGLLLLSRNKQAFGDGLRRV